MITQKQLKELFEYNELTGKLTQRTKTSYKVDVGEEAGYTHKETNNLYYRRVSILGRAYLVHRLIFLYMNGSMPKEHVDHIDGNGLNNKWENLREASRFENQKNRSVGTNNKTGIIGVWWCKNNCNWKANININGKQEYLGTFYSFIDACACRKSSELKHDYHPNHGSRRHEKTRSIQPT